MKTNLRKMHPNLWLGLLLYSLWYISWGLAIALVKTAQTPYHFNHVRFGLFFTIIGLIVFININFIHSRVITRTFISIGMMATVLTAFGYGLAFFRHEIPSFHGAITYLFMGIIQFAPLSEPGYNPLTEKRNE